MPISSLPARLVITRSTSPRCCRRSTVFSFDLNLAVAAPAREIVPTARREPASWRRTEVRPSSEWTREDFDDRGWCEAPGGFGTRGPPGATVRTEWRSREIWLRRSFMLPEGDRKALALSVHHDKDAEIYLNGVLAARLTGFVSDYEEIPISEQARTACGPERTCWPSIVARPAAASILTSGSSCTRAGQATYSGDTPSAPT